MSDYLYAGAFNPGGEGGYFVFAWNEETGSAQLTCTCLSEISVGMHAFDEKRGILYLTDERTKNPDFISGGGGRVFAVAIDPSTGSLREISRCPSYGAGASFCAVSKDSRYLLVTNFGGHSADDCVTYPAKDENGNWQVHIRHDQASTALLKLSGDGSFEGPADVCLHDEYESDGKLILPHAHSVSMSPDGKFFAVCDMGTDEIRIFKIENEKLISAASPLKCRKGSGPRYCAFHPSKPFFFANFEELPYAASYRINDDGTLDEITNLELLTGDDVIPENKESGMIMSPDGRFLYACMRGIDTIEVIAVNQESGELSHLQRIKTDCVRLKDCALSPGGKYLTASARGNSSVELFKVNADGTLEKTGTVLDVKNAGHVFFIHF